jgi:hypothetical protein
VTGVQTCALSDLPSLDKTTERNLYLHRIDFNLFDVISIGIMEGLMVGNSSLEIRYLSPLMIFHSLYSSWDYPLWGPEQGDLNGSLLSLEVNWNILKAVAVYGQFVMTEYATPYELEGWPDVQPPNGLGYLAGVRYSRSFGAWGSIFYGEFIYTDPYLYMNSSPFASFIWMRRLSLDASRVRFEFIGYPRDTVSLTLGAQFFKDDVLRITGECTYLSRGEHGVSWDWGKGPPYTGERTPSGTAENRIIASAAVLWKAFHGLSLGGGITGIVSLDNNHVRGSDAFGGQVSFLASYVY